jgi:hypothetical protein
LAKYIDDHYDKIVPLLPHMVINNISWLSFNVEENVNTVWY